MANKTLERKLLGAMLRSPELVNRVELQSIWFTTDERHKELASILLDDKLQFKDFSEIELHAKSRRSTTEVNEDWLRGIQFDFLNMQDAKRSAKALRKEYYIDKAQQASQTYAHEPTAEHRQLAEDWFRKMSDLNIEEDTGDIGSTLHIIADEMENGREPGIQSFSKLDKILGAGFEPGNLFIVGARPGVGKSAFMLNLAREVLIHNNIRIDVFSLEMSKKEVLERFLSRLTGITSYQFRNSALSEEAKRSVYHSIEWLANKSIHVHDTLFSISDIERMIRQRYHDREEGQEYMAFIDYLQLVDHEQSHLNTSQAVGSITTRLKRLTGELGIPIMLLSQLNRGIEQRQDNTPTLSDLRESGNIEQDGYTIAFLSKDEEMSEENADVEVQRLTIAKNRGGKTGTIFYQFDKPKMSYTEVNYHG